MNALIRHMGAEFDRLPETVRRAHQGVIRLEGTVRVSSATALTRWLADRLRLPKSGELVHLQVLANHEAEQVIWRREFDGHPLLSTFRSEGEFLVEHMGPLKLQLHLRCENLRLVYHLHRCTIAGLPLPRRLSPHLRAWEGDSDGKYEFAVAVSLPFLGELIAYQGVLDLLPETGNS